MARLYTTKSPFNLKGFRLFFFVDDLEGQKIFLLIITEREIERKNLEMQLVH